MKRLNQIVMTLFLCVAGTLVIGQQRVFALSIFKYDFTGTVIRTTPNEHVEPLPEIMAGDTFTGNLTLEYDPVLKDQVPSDDGFGAYDTYGSYSIIFDNLTIRPYYISGYLPTVIINDSGIGEDQLTIYDFTPNPVDCSSDDLYFKFTDTTGTVFDNDALPYGIDFNIFDEMTIWFDLMGPSLSSPLYGKDVTAMINSIVQVPVPEPGTLLLLISGLGIGAMVRRKKW